MVFRYAVLAPGKNNTYTFTPVNAWRSFRPHKEYATLSLEEAEQFDEQQGNKGSKFKTKRMEEKRQEVGDVTEGGADDENEFNVLGGNA